METGNRFTGRTVVVTGAGSGIGRATARRLSEEGAEVVAVDVDQDRLNELGAEVHVLPVAGDLTDASVIDRVIAAADGPIHGLANVAGIMDGFLPAAEVDDDTWDRVFGLNVTVPMRLTRAVLPLMIEAGAGSIVNIASEAALRGGAAGAAYTASKHAVVGFTKNTAFFYGPKGIRTNAVAPGATATNIEGSMRSEYAGKRIGPIMKAAVPEPVGAGVIANAVTWLLSDDAANVNGAVLPSDGGWSAV
ncbi:SDR family NAD(P)-dependent oxidoreductase [Glycomyces sp. A-F 0318]|uniref:SDR family NAD(P)-dependent oxidoreductase n=1 Tax=Glycomyces amatae TaxID=2881355 RepID=UPI001E58F579|nr:SDR family NAD(P)-dependent oxidoreductase [Glycomyces amatae]MCD0444141.1 SDR family NAD(P)-dependent oxidoreductase [Glycomyces amatae]